MDNTHFTQPGIETLLKRTNKTKADGLNATWKRY